MDDPVTSAVPGPKGAGLNNVDEKLAGPRGGKSPSTLRSLIVAMVGAAIFGASTATLLESGPGGGPGMVSMGRANAIVEKLTHRQAHVERVFPGPNGLTGMVIDGSQGPVISWMTNTRSAVIIGGVVDAETNQNMTLQATEHYAQTGNRQPMAAKSGDAAANAGDAGGAAQAANAPDQHAALSGESALQSFLTSSRNGDLAEVSQPGLSGPHSLYVFVDPNCIFCHKMFEYVQSHQVQLQKAGVRVVYVPVAILKQSSIAKAAEIVKNGWTALSQDEQGFNDGSEEGGLIGLSGADFVRYSAPVHANSRWLRNLSAANHASEGTPFLVWRAGNGQAYYLDGFPTAQGFEKVLSSMQDGWKPAK